MGNQRMKNALFGLSAIMALVVSVIYLLTIGGISLTDRFPLLDYTYVGVFIVSATAVVVILANGYYGLSLGEKFNSFLRNFRNAPKWLLLVLIVHIFVFLLSQHPDIDESIEKGAPEIKEGKYVLVEHNQILRQISQPEYAKLLVTQTRSKAGIALIFSLVAVAVLYPETKEREDRMKSKMTNS